MYYPSSIVSVVVFLTLLKYTGAAIIGDAKKNLHHHMTKREIEFYFGVKDHSEIPEYDVTHPMQTESNGRVMTHFRRRRSVAHPDVLHYKLHAFGSKLKLRLKRNSMLMAPNLVIETHHRDGVVTTRPAAKNKFYLGKLPSDPDSLVALRSDRGLTGMIRTSRDTFFVQPLPTHLAKRVRRSADSTPHLIYRATPLKKHASGCQMKKSVNDRFKRSTLHHRKPRSATPPYKYMEAALVVPQHFVDKYGANRFDTVLLVIANMVAGMYQDPSMGKFRIYYIVTKIFHIKSTYKELGFNVSESGSAKLSKLLGWSKRYMTKEDSDPEHFDVFSYITDKMIGGLAIADRMCDYKTPNGNINSDVGLQTALYVAHETGHNMNLYHDGSAECPSMKYIMSGILPTGVYAATWSNCSRKILEKFLGSKRSRCLDDSPFQADIPTLPPADQSKLPGEIFDGNDQCEMQYGKEWTLSPYRPGVCDKLYCFRRGVELSKQAPMADGSPCGIRHWCIGGKCEDNGKKRINGRWTSWSSSYSPCTRACDGGVQFRKRECTNPRPAYGGKPCEGSDKEWRICNSGPCAAGTPTFRHEQCNETWGGSWPFFHGNPCNLFCRRGNTVRGKGTVKDGTRCYSDKQKLDVCIQQKCWKVGCDHILDSNTMVDRCGKCGGDGEECRKLKVDGFYNKTHTVIGPANADLIARLPVGTEDVYFRTMVASYNGLGVQADSGTYLVGGHMGRNQQVNAAGTTIIYSHKRSRTRDKITIKGPTDSFLRVMYIYKQGSNPGVEFSYMRPVQAGETVPESKYEWKNGTWSSCSATCGQGVRTRSMRCIRSDDQTPATDKACGSKPTTTEKCSLRDCPSEWHTTDWTDCSKSCGKGQQTRKLVCRMKITANKYGLSNSCSNNTKPVVKETIRSCNSFACKADWDTEEGLPGIECGDPIDPKTLSCYRMDQFGEKSLVPPYLCRLRPKPTRLPCTTPSTAPLSTTPRSTTSTTAKTTKRSQAIQAQCSVLLTLLLLLWHLM